MEDRLHPWLLIVTGPPAAGKSTLASHLAEDLGLPLFTKDGFKEVLFDSLGYSDAARSRQLSGAAYDLLFHAAGAVLGAGLDCMVEANFDVAASLPSFRRLAHQAPYRSLQIVCRAEPDTLARRYAVRQQSGERHPGHHGDLLDDPAALLHRHAAMALNGPAVEVDNKRESSQNYPALLERLRALMADGYYRCGGRERPGV